MNDDSWRPFLFNGPMTNRMIRITRLAAATGAGTPANIFAG
jgi:hypothetical protein